MKKRILKVISIVSAFLVCLFGYYFLNKQYNISIPCMFRKLTGFLCPGCGITRCLFSIINGNITKAFDYNELATILLLPSLGYISVNMYQYINNKSYIKIPNIIWNILLIITIIFGIIRNIFKF